MKTVIHIGSYLLDLPCIRTFTKEEWKAMSRKEKSRYVKPGKSIPGRV